jgi:hypothetical protein
MTCELSTTSLIKNLYIECQTPILDQFSITNRVTLNSVSYLVIPVISSNYTRLLTERSELIDTLNAAFIRPKPVKVGFTVRIVNNDWNVRRCLEYLAISSITSSYNTYIPVTVLDYVRPEVTDANYTVRKGMLTLSAGNGRTGNYTEDYEITFNEITKRVVM